MPMVSPFGLIVHPNPDRKAEDVYALVLDGIVINNIKASYNDIQAIYKTYDYCVDITVSNQFAGPHDMYDGGQDVFSRAPAPPVDYVENVHADFSSIISLIQQTGIDKNADGSPLTVQQYMSGYNSALNDNPDLSPTFLALMQSIYNYVLGGGG